ncbi:hypothetical protein EVAR_78996_1 [Eumeta japonica]|uniref:Uncharacterized protein n=1 Tax=Eumeta variegata TaxID=151549 RepID=A0A4C1USU5_EUMVA|nr:hypothetical protein EVAR_78996_1 [Eumeta japonica]
MYMVRVRAEETRTWLEPGAGEVTSAGTPAVPKYEIKANVQLESSARAGQGSQPSTGVGSESRLETRAEPMAPDRGRARD